MCFQRFALSLDRQVRAVGIFSLCCAGMLSSALAQPPNDRPASRLKETQTGDIGRLINDLRDSSFAVREAASLRLLEIGEPGLSALHAAASDPSPEVRQRVATIRTEVERLVFEERARGFLISTNPSEDFGLPAWKQFREVVGTTRSSKLLFLEMLRRQRELALSIHNASEALGTPNEQTALEEMSQLAALSAQQVRANMTYGGMLPEIGDAVGLLTACALMKDQPSIEINLTITSAMYRGEVGEYFSKAGYGRCMRALAGKWMPKTQEVMAADVLSLAMQKDVAEGALVARKHLGKNSDRDIRIAAFQCLARFGDTNDIPLLETHLNDQTILHQFEGSILLSRGDINIEESAPPLGRRPKPALPASDSEVMTVRVSHLALATCMLLAKEDPAAVFPRFQAFSSRGFSLNSIAFPIDDQDSHAQAVADWLQRQANRNLTAN
jgi:HEAT repeat protein